MQPPYPPPTPIETSQQHYFGYEDTYQQQPNDYANDHLYYAQHESQQQFYQHPQLAGSSSSSESQYFSYSSDASIAPVASSTPFYAYDQSQHDAQQHQVQPVPSASASLPFEFSGDPQFSRDDMFAFTDTENRFSVEDEEQKPSIAPAEHERAPSAPFDHPAPAPELASDSSLSDAVNSNPLLRQDLHKNGTPKRPLNSFMIFSRFRRPQLQKEQPDIKASDLSKVLADEWRNLSKDVRQRFANDAKTVKRNFHNMHPDYVYTRRPNGAKRNRSKRANTPSSAGSSGEQLTPAKNRGPRKAGSKSILGSSTSGRPDAELTLYRDDNRGGYSSSASSTCSSFFPSAVPSVFNPPSRVTTPGYLQPPSTAGTSSSFGFPEPSHQGEPSVDTAHDQSHALGHSQGAASTASSMLANMDLQKSRPPSVGQPALSRTTEVPPALRLNLPQRSLPSVFRPVPIAPPITAQARQIEEAAYVESPAGYARFVSEPRPTQHALYSSSGSSSLSSSTGSAYSNYQAQPIPAHRFPLAQAWEPFIPQSLNRATSPPPAPLPAPQTIYNGPSDSRKTQQRLSRAAGPSRDQSYRSALPPLSISTSMSRSAPASSLPVPSGIAGIQQSGALPWSAASAPNSAPLSSPTMLSLSAGRSGRRPPVSGRTLVNRHRNGSNASNTSSSDGSVASSAFFAVPAFRTPSTLGIREDPFLLPKIGTNLPASPGRAQLPPAFVHGHVDPSIQPVYANESGPPPSLPSLSSIGLLGKETEPSPNRFLPAPPAQRDPVNLPSATPARSYTTPAPVIQSDLQANQQGTIPQTSYASSLHGYTIYQAPPQPLPQQQNVYQHEQRPTNQYGGWPQSQSYNQ